MAPTVTYIFFLPGNPIEGAVNIYIWFPRYAFLYLSGTRVLLKGPRHL